MSDNFEYTAKINVETTNSKKTIGDIDAIVAQLKELNKTASKTLEEFAQLNGKGFTSVSSGAKQASASVKTFSNDLSQLGIKGQLLGKVNDNLKLTSFGSSNLADKHILLNKEQERSIANLPRLRYALYDVSASMSALSATLIGGVTASLTFSAKFEKAFTTVERTTMASDAALKLLRNQLVNLSTEIPIAFENLSSIAALGSQLGIASNDLIGFTKTISEFAATTNVSTDEAAKGFGRLGELLGVLPKDYRNLASAIALVGVKSAATESEILRTSTGIAGVAKTAGLTTDYVVGLSGALASLGVPAEQSRGALTRIFQEVNRAAADGGPELDAFAKILGVTTSEAKNLAQTDMQGFFSQLLNGLSGFDSGQLTSALDSINLSDVRVTNTLARLSKNIDFTNELLGLASDEFKSGTFLAFAYGKTIDDLSSRFQILQNSLAALGASIGDAIAPFAKDIINFLIDFVNGLSAIANSPAGQALIIFNSILAVTVGTISAVVASLALFGASLSATKTALIAMGASATTANVAVRGLGTAFKAVAVIGIVATFAEIIVAMVGMQQASQDASAAFTKMVNDTSGLSDALAADSAAYQKAFEDGNTAIVNSFIPVSASLTNSNDEYSDYQKTLKNTAAVLGITLPDSYSALNSAITGNTQYIGENTRAWLKNALLNSPEFQSGAQNLIDAFKAIGLTMDDVINYVTETGSSDGLVLWFAKQAKAAGWSNEKIAQFIVGNKAFTDALAAAGLTVEGFINQLQLLGITSDGASTSLDNVAWSAEFTGKKFDKVTKPVTGAAKAVKTLTDYANDLRDVFQRSFDIRWQAILSADEVADSWLQLGQRITEARNRIFDLTSTRDKLEYFLSIAVKAGDTMRINELTAQLASANADLASATDDASTELNGNSAAARRNRRELLNIIQANATYLSSLAASGTSQSELSRVAGELNADFMDQATALGYSQSEAAALAVSYGDLATIIKSVPRDITVKANTSPAQQALNEFIAQANSSKATVTVDYVETAAYQKWKRGQVIQSSIDLKNAQLQKAKTNSQWALAVTLADAITRLTNQLASGSYASGGYTGAGGKYEPAGVVHKGEYVIPKQYVNQSTGMPYADALGRMLPASAPATSGYANGGLVSGGMMVSLSPDDRALLRGIGASGDVVVAVDSREIARANARGAKLVTAEGGYLA